MVAPRVRLVMGIQGLAAEANACPLQYTARDLGLHATTSCTQSYTITKAAENGGTECPFSRGAAKNCSEDRCSSSYVPSPPHVSVAHLYVNPRLAGIKVEPFTLSDGTRSNRSNVTRRDLANVEGGETLTLRGRGRIEAPIPTPPGSEFYSFLPKTLVQICNPIGVCFDASPRVADDKMSLRLSVPSYSDLCADRDGRPACVENSMYLAIHITIHAPSSWQGSDSVKMVCYSSGNATTQICKASCGGGNFSGCPAAEEGGALYLLRDSCRIRDR